MVTRHDGVTQTYEGWLNEQLYGSRSQLKNSCGFETFLCRTSIYFGGEIPEEIELMPLEALSGIDKAIDKVDKLKTVPTPMKAPVKVLKGALNWEAAGIVCEAACDAKLRVSGHK
jgi:hypothetical protein